MFRLRPALKSPEKIATGRALAEDFVGYQQLSAAHGGALEQTASILWCSAKVKSIPISTEDSASRQVRIT
jgi:hypothetical protein